MKKSEIPEELLPFFEPVYRPDQGRYQTQGPLYNDTGTASRFFKQVQPDFECTRAHSLVICPDCGTVYKDHPVDGKYPWLHVLCDGTRVKL